MRFRLLTIGLALLLLCLRAPLQGQDIETVAKADPLVFNGSLSSGFQFYKVYGSEPRSANPMWNINGSANLSVYGFNLPFSFTLGRTGSNYTYPIFGQVGMSPKYKWLTVHAGWRNMNFSPYTLAGHTFLGAGIELTPGKLRLSAMYGRLRAAREAQSDSLGVLFPPVYKRMGYGVKLGVGSATRYFDLIYFKAKDDAQSIRIPVDSTVLPAENGVVGYGTRFGLGKGVSFFSDGAISMYTRNQFSTPADSSDLKEVPPLVKPAFSTRLNYALRTGISMRIKQFELSGIYERIAPNYETMGSYFFNNDVENITINPNLSILQNKLRFNGSLGLQKNNLLNTRSETTQRVIGNALLSINPGPRFGCELVYMNAAVRQSDGLVALSDTLRVSVINTNMAVSPHWNWVDSMSSRSLSLSGNYQELNDRNPFTREFTDLKTTFGTAFYSQQYLLASWGWSAGINFNHIALAQLKTQRYGGSLGINKSLLEGSLSGGLTATVNASAIEGRADGSVISASVNLSWTYQSKFTLSIYTNLLRNQSREFGNFSEWQGGATVSRNFSSKKQSSTQN